MQVSSLRLLLIFGLYMEIFNGGDAIKSESEKSSTRLGVKMKDKLERLRLSYSDWKTWSERYPECNPTTNPNRSPIVINGQDAIKNSKLKPIAVYSGSPVEACLFFSEIYRESDFELEAVNIVPSPICKRLITRISSGQRTLLYFKRAVLLYTRSMVEPERSLHQIDGKQFQMEIAIEFADNDDKVDTEMHIMVEAIPAGQIAPNPVFKALEIGTEALKKTLVSEVSGKRKDEYKAVETKCIDFEKTYFEAVLREETETKNMFYEDRINHLKTLLSNIRGLTNDQFKNLTDTLKGLQDSVPETRTNESKFEAEHESLQKTRAEIIRSLKAKAKSLTKDEEYYDLIEQFKNNTKGLDKVHAKMNTTKDLLESLLKREAKAESEMKELREILVSNKVGIPGESNGSEMRFDSPDAVHLELEKFTKEFKSLVEAKTAYNETCTKLIEYRKKMGFGLIEEQFQISWLFPTGGYYQYNGSNPIPPCDKRRRTVVFRNPLKITTNQLALFQSIPSFAALQKASSAGKTFDEEMKDFDDDLKVDTMIPILNKNAEDQKIWFVNGLIYTEDDLFHRKTEGSHNRLKLVGETSGENPTIMRHNFVPFWSFILLGRIASTF